ncbi:MAG: hypothetical protein ACJ741_03690 [Pyrinomonadaceae bacterium]
MKLLVLNHAEVEALLPMRKCVEVMVAAEYVYHRAVERGAGTRVEF